MKKTNKSKIALLFLLCAWPGFIFIADAGYQGWLLTAIYILWLATTVLIGKIVLQDKTIGPVTGTTTQIYDLTLKELGFRYNVQHERWQIGCIGAPCFIFYNPPSSNSMPNMMECSNYVSGNDEHLVRIVHCIEDIKLVLNACGITDSMIEKAQDTWK